MGKLDITIGSRLALGFGAVLSFLLLSLVVYVIGIQQVGETTAFLTQQVMPRVEAARDLETGYLHQLSSARAYVDSGSEAELVEYRQGMAMTTDAASRLSRIPKSADGMALFDQMQTAGGRFTQAAESAIVLRQQGKADQAAQVISQQLYPARDELLRLAAQFITLQSQYRVQVQADVDRTRGESFRNSLAIAALALICGALLAYSTARSVRRPLHRLVEASVRLAGGDYEEAKRLAGTVAGEGGEAAHNEVRLLAARMAATVEALGVREGRLAAQSRLSALLASSIDVGRLATGALREMAENSGAEVGVVYLYDGSQRLLHRVASHCLGDEAPEVVKWKEGIVGEAAASRRTMLVREMPAGLPFRVRLGIDDLPPSWVVAVPMISGEELVGVALLAGLKGPGKDALEFAEGGARQLAVSLQNALTHERVAAQNEELQSQNEEIQAQNEEIHAQNEEILAQSEELQSQNEELEAQANDLAEQNQQLAQQTEQIARLQEIALRLSESLSPGEVLDRVVDAAMGLTGSRLASVLLLDEAGEEFTVAAAAGLDPEQAAQFRLPRAGSLADEALAGGRTVFLEDLSTDPRVRLPQLAGGEAVGSLIVLPMVVRGERLGVVEVYFIEPRCFADADPDLLSALGSAAAVAVHNSGLFDAAERQRRLLERVLAGIPEAVVVTDRQGKVLLSNGPAREMLGVEEGIALLPEEGNGAGEDMGTLGEMVGAALGGRELLEREVRFRNRLSGSEGYAQVRSAPISIQGRVVRAVLVAADISHLKEIEQAKDEFLSVVSHELKSPLTSVKGYAQLLTRSMASGTSGDRLERMAQTIVEQADRVVAQVNRLLEMSRAQMGRLEIHPESMDLAGLVRTQLQAAQVKSSSHRLVEELRGDLRGRWDPAYLEQVVANLLDNAMRYSPDGGEVRVVAERLGGMVRMRVSDQGIGIPREMQEQVFERHFRTDQAKRVRSDGLGIGLYLVRQVVAGHGGRVWVESEPGKGSSFTVELPVNEG